MSSTLIAAITVACVFGGALLGLGLQRLLPQNHLTKESQDVIKLGAGVIATITALVLSLLISSAKATFDQMNSRIIQVSAKILVLDGVLTRYGPETKGAREQVRRSIETMLGRIWPSEHADVSGEAAIEHGGEIGIVRDKLRALNPDTDTQRQLLVQAQQVVDEIAESRWMLIEESQIQLPTPLIVVLVLWLTMLFTSFGLFAPRNATIVAVLFMCACSMSAAIFLMLEMNRPLDGFIKVSSAPVRTALTHLGQ
ncbi:MAG TPA: hypothetical protein VGK30_00765 [Candidatus Binatia bacterium]|jgi:uncharacterized membrane protein